VPAGTLGVTVTVPVGGEVRFTEYEPFEPSASVSEVGRILMNLGVVSADADQPPPPTPVVARTCTSTLRPSIPVIL